MIDQWESHRQSERASLRWRRLRTELAQAPNRERRSQQRKASDDRPVNWSSVDAAPLVSVFGSSRPVMPDQAPCSSALPASPSASSVRFVGWRRRLPLGELQALLRDSYARVQRLNTPPRGQSFYLDGKPYATDDEFIDDLCEELRGQFKRYLEGISKDLV